MESQPTVTTVTHINLNGRYRIKIERAASTKGVDGFTVEANGDCLTQCWEDVDQLYAKAKAITAPPEIRIGQEPTIAFNTTKPAAK